MIFTILTDVEVSCCHAGHEQKHLAQVQLPALLHTAHDWTQTQRIPGHQLDASSKQLCGLLRICCQASCGMHLRRFHVMYFKSLGVKITAVYIYRPRYSI